MPKKIFDSFLQNLKRDIKTNFMIGDRYYTIREISLKLGVALQTAQKGVKLLCEEKMLKASPRSGITILALEPEEKLKGKILTVLSAKHDKRFNSAFCDGISEIMTKYGIELIFIENQFERTSSLEFGKYLCKLKTDGIIALGFMDSSLGFYHAIREGVDIISDIGMDDLPLLPVVQTDNYNNAREAGIKLAKQGYSNIIASGYFPPGNKRFQGFLDGIKQINKQASVKHLYLGEVTSNIEFDRFFFSFSSRHAAYSLDYAANYILASKFMQHEIKVEKNNFLVYDSEEDFFIYDGLPPITSSAPSLKSIAGCLAEKMISKWLTGTFQHPLFEKI